jgi:hypothetical protein
MNGKTIRIHLVNGLPSEILEGTSKTYQDWHEEKLAKAGAAPVDAE